MKELHEESKPLEERLAEPGAVYIDKRKPHIHPSVRQHKIDLFERILCALLPTCILNDSEQAIIDLATSLTELALKKEQEL